MRGVGTGLQFQKGCPEQVSEGSREASHVDIKGKNVPGTASEKSLKQSMVDVFLAKANKQEGQEQEIRTLQANLKTLVFALKWEATRGF